MKYGTLSLFEYPLITQSTPNVQAFGNMETSLNQPCIHCRVQLEDAQNSLMRTNEELQFTKRELYVAQTQLTHSDRMLLETELRLSLLSQSRFVPLYLGQI